ncbi:MAG: NUDIX domain-containing protein [Candidatus Thermoplasmatota archaeon]
MPLRRKVMVFPYRTEPRLEVLLLKRVKADKGDWHPVTGNVEAHEQIPNAALREIDEETGLSVSIEPLGVTFTYEVKEGRRSGRYHETAFAAKVLKAEAVTLSEEHTASEWLSPEEAGKRLSWPEQKRALDALVKRYA